MKPAAIRPQWARVALTFPRPQVLKCPEVATDGHVFLGVVVGVKRA
jgi:hypothetical protein